MTDNPVSPPPPRANRRVLIWVSAVIALLLAFGAGVLATKLLSDPEVVVILGMPGTEKKATSELTVADADRSIEFRTEDGSVALCDLLPGQLKMTTYFEGDDADETMRAAERLAGADSAMEVLKTETRQQAVERFNEIFADHPEMLEKVRPEALPASITIVARGGAAITDVKARAASFPGVEVVTEEVASTGLDTVNPEIACELSEGGAKVLADAYEKGQAIVP